jgi:hypothetical protein
LSPDPEVGFRYEPLLRVPGTGTKLHRFSFQTGSIDTILVFGR